MGRHQEAPKFGMKYPYLRPKYSKIVNYYANFERVKRDYLALTWLIEQNVWADKSSKRIKRKLLKVSEALFDIERDFLKVVK